MKVEHWFCDICDKDVSDNYCNELEELKIKGTTYEVCHACANKFDRLHKTIIKVNEIPDDDKMQKQDMAEMIAGMLGIDINNPIFFSSGSTVTSEWFRAVLHKVYNL